MRTPYPDLVASPELVTYKFRFQINGTSDPDAILPVGHGITDITRTGAGVFAVTLQNAHPTFVGATGMVMSVTAGQVSYGLIVQTTPGSYVASTGVLTVHVVDPYTDATPAAVDPTDNDWVYVEATFCRTNYLVTSGAI